MKQKKSQSGFSLIEVLVASAILIVIVMMLAMLFQHTSHAWRIGVRRAGAYMQIRAVVGAIQRDASAAVDESTIDQEIIQKLGGISQNFSGSLSFYTLTGAGKDTASSGSTGAKYRRTPAFITYSGSGARTEKYLLPDGNVKESSSNIRDFMANTSVNSPSIGSLTFTEGQRVSGESNNSLPPYVIIRTSVTTQGKARDIGAASAGPDCVWGTKDDIRTWLE